jgi:integrase
MKLTQDAVSKLVLSPDRGERIVWDSDIPGFGIRIRLRSSNWFFRYRRGGRQPRVTIGAVSAISAAQARTIASQLYARVKLGEDPAGARAETLARANETFASVLQPYLARRQAELRPRSYQNCERHLMRQAAPLHRLELTKAAERRTVASLLTKIATKSGPVEANCVKSSLSGFFIWMIGQGLIEGTDPTMGMAGAVTNGPRAHVPTDADMMKIWGALQNDDYGDIVRLLALTLCRLTEIGGLRWDEVKFQAGGDRAFACAREDRREDRPGPPYPHVDAGQGDPGTPPPPVGRRPAVGIRPRYERLHRVGARQAQPRQARRRHRVDAA